MRMLTKVVIFIIILSISLSTLASCHGKNERIAFEVPDSFDTERQYDIVFWAKNENNATQREVYEKAIAQFESYYPNINVTVKHFTSYDDIYNDVITNIQTGTTPNVCITYSWLSMAQIPCGLQITRSLPHSAHCLIQQLWWASSSRRSLRLHYSVLHL